MDEIKEQVLKAKNLDELSYIEEKEEMKFTDYPTWTMCKTAIQNGKLKKEDLDAKIKGNN